MQYTEMKKTWVGAQNWTMAIGDEKVEYYTDNRGRLKMVREFSDNTSFVVKVAACPDTACDLLNADHPAHEYRFKNNVLHGRAVEAVSDCESQEINGYKTSYYWKGKKESFSGYWALNICDMWPLHHLGSEVKAVTPDTILALTNR